MAADRKKIFDYTKGNDDFIHPTILCIIDYNCTIGDNLFLLYAIYIYIYIYCSLFWLLLEYELCEAVVYNIILVLHRKT